jgi:hypothetical protein
MRRHDEPPVFVGCWWKLRHSSRDRQFPKVHTLLRKEATMKIPLSTRESFQLDNLNKIYAYDCPRLRFCSLR